MSALGSSDPAATALLDLIGGYRVTATLYVAVRLGIPDLLAEGARSTADLAQRSGADHVSVGRLVRALVTLGICRPVGDERFELTAMGRYLTGSAEPSLRSWALFEGSLLYQSWGALLDSIRAGKNAAELAGAQDPFEFIARSPQVLKIFNEAMLSMTHLIIPDLLAAYDFSAIGRLMDVGGGYGQLLCAVLTAYPAMSGAIYDLPQCSDGARAHIAERGLSSRAEFLAGNFFGSVPAGADAIILKSVIHDWTDERSVEILANCRRALPPTGKLLLVERPMPETLSDTPADRSATLSDLNMLRGPGGCERTIAEYGQLLGRGGFALSRVLPAGRWAVIEAAVA